MNKSKFGNIATISKGKKESLEVAKMSGCLRYIQIEDLRNDNNLKYCVPNRSSVAVKENDYDLSLNRYKEIVYDEVEYEQPQVIIGKIMALDWVRLRR